MVMVLVLVLVLVLVRGLLTRYIAPLHARARTQFNIKDVSPIQCCPSSFVPTLFIHGALDTLIDKSHSVALYQAYSGDKRLVMAVGDHNSPRDVDVIEEVCRWLKVCLRIDNDLGTFVGDYRYPPWEHREAIMPPRIFRIFGSPKSQSQAPARSVNDAPPPPAFPPMPPSPRRVVYNAMTDSASTATPSAATPSLASEKKILNLPVSGPPAAPGAQLARTQSQSASEKVEVNHESVSIQN